ncbi:uncharacterized protein GGS25DRAFT_75390 [Hypoxylon fragiforme]|uniref:uncharacterized protein n=1 Tax=Hypoxylon fragiforme TaxID=63214 RepID=UPI0020C66888|nr:uncharacterized protein GGS25DRAFT_75390 [Hypoxylon fragiforme]KAI2602973.1 hypothetical protein GGS25DRAFT_75390 [Hypoxylon fragiforme]
MQVLPFLQVSDLPPSASLYAAITQPLGLRFVSADSASIVFGDLSSPTPEPVFEVKNSIRPKGQAIQPCHLVLSAASPSAVYSFYTAALRANPALEDAGKNFNYLHIHDDPNSIGDSRARIGDFDGNIMEVIHSGSRAGRRSESSSREVSRVLDWNLDMNAAPAHSRSIASGSSGSSRAAGNEPYTIMKKSVTTSTVEHAPPESPRGFSATGLVGSLLGVAVGAAVTGALTYGMGNKEREREQAYQEMPPFMRRSTCPDQLPDTRPRYYPPTSYGGGYSQAGTPKSRAGDDMDDRASRHSSHYTTGSRSRGRSQSTSRQPLMITEAEHRSNAGSKRSNSPRQMAEADHRGHRGSRHNEDRRSHTGSRHSGDHHSGRPASRSRRHSPELEDHGYFSSKHASPRPSRHSPESEDHDYFSSKHASPRPREPEVETYVSARSDRSTAASRPRLARVETAPSRASSIADSRYSAATVRGPVAKNHGSARHNPQPESSVGTNYAYWNGEACSVAPSDSISNVGNRHGRRSQYA